MAYKKKDFETALQHYAKAIELDPTNANFLTNRAGQLWNTELTATSINLLVYRESVNVIGYSTRRLSADSLQL